MNTKPLVVTTVAALLSLPGCKTATPPPSHSMATSLPSNGEEPSPHEQFTLHVSNQSFAISPVDIHVTIDGQSVVDQSFEVGSQHNWKTFKLSLSHGKHTLKVSSKKGEAVLSKEFEVTADHWAVIDYWYYPASHYNPTPKKFSFHISNSPISFQ